MTEEKLTEMFGKFWQEVSERSYYSVEPSKIPEFIAEKDQIIKRYVERVLSDG